MDRIIRVEAGETIEDVVNKLLDYKERGEHVYTYFNGHKLHSDTVSLDSAYLEITGYTQQEFNEKRMTNLKKEAEETKKREEGYHKRVEATRTDMPEPITKEKVINGLKFIAENKDLDQEELIDGLLNLGCNFSFEDIKQQFPEKVEMFDGMLKGDLSCGATIIVNVRDSEFGRSFGYDKFLRNDDDTSVYNFIRTVTGDNSYTKESVESKKKNKTK